jgi:hypothetical protein
MKYGIGVNVERVLKLFLTGMWKEETPAAARYPSLMMAGHIGEEKQPKPKRNTVWTNRLSVS